MEEARTPASYFIAVIAVIGGAFLMPSFPIFIMVVCPLLLLGILAYSIFKGKRRQRHLLGAVNCPLTQNAHPIPSQGAMHCAPTPMRQ